MLKYEFKDIIQKYTHIKKTDMKRKSVKFYIFFYDIRQKKIDELVSL